MKVVVSLSGERRRFMRLDPVMQVLDGDAGGATDVDDRQFTRAHQLIDGRAPDAQQLRRFLGPREQALRQGQCVGGFRSDSFHRGYRILSRPFSALSWPFFRRRGE